MVTLEQGQLPDVGPGPADGHRLVFLLARFASPHPQPLPQAIDLRTVAALAKGDEVVTAGGLVGKITKIEDHFVHVELAKGMTVKVAY